MAVLTTEAIVLHVQDYLESSRILRLATRDAGVQSVLARGARNSRRRFGSALDLFAGGVAEIQMRPGRDLHTLARLEVARSRTALASDLGRFTGASALAELMLRFAHEDAHPALFDALESSLDALCAVDVGDPRDVALAGAWHLVAELGFAPAIDICGSCHSPVPPGDAAAFSHAVGGVLCARCVGRGVAGGNRTLPPEARTAIRAWLGGDRFALAGAGERRAHARLLREFLNEHLTDGRPLRAYDVWEHAHWGERPPAERA